jgi:Protein of unknown function (DUF998)
MRGALAGVDPASSRRTARLRGRTADTGIADRGGHDRPFVAPPIRGGAIIRRMYALLIAIAVAIVVFHELVSQFTRGHHDGHTQSQTMRAEDLLWALPAIALGAAVGAVLVVASASRAGLSMLERLGLPGLGRNSRAWSNGLAWAAIGVLGVHFTGEAFDVFPGGHTVVAVILGSALGLGTFRLHRHSIEHEAYRTFNLIAMLLAAGCLASMSITPTGEWWTRNFSTLGTSDDIAAACFNVAIVVAGAGMAGMSGGLTRAVRMPRYGARRGGVTAMRALIIAIGVSLMGVGLVPIDGATDLHNAAASSAAAAFAVLCLCVQLWARRLPRSLVIASYASIAIEVIAMIAYDGIGVFNLTVFEVVAFTLVFAWLIALVALTHGDPVASDAAGRRHLARSLPAPHPAAVRDGVARRRRAATRSGPPGRLVSRASRPSHRSGALRDVQRALRRGSDADEPPDPVVTAGLQQHRAIVDS